MRAIWDIQHPHQFDPDQFVYHYTTRDTALEFILPERRLKLGLFGKMNDPRDAKALLLGLSNAVSDGFECRRIITYAGQKLKNVCKVLCVTRDDPQFCQGGNVLCRGFAHSRMWAQYANNHDGVCLVFDKQKLNEAVTQGLGYKGRVFHDLVKYKNNYFDGPAPPPLDYQEITSKGLESYLDEYVDQHHQALFFHKNTDWEAEWEHRWVLRGNDEQEEYVYIENALIGIFLGVDFPRVYMPLVKRHGIPFLRIYWNNFGIPAFEHPHIS